MLLPALLAAVLLQPPPPTGPLAGPSVMTPDRAPTLVARDFDGKVKRLDEPAEEAALRLLTLSDAEKSKAAAITAARAAILDAVLADNIPLLLKLQGLRDGSARDEGLAALRELSAKLRPLRERGRLRDEIAGALTPENASKFIPLVDEYWKAVLAERAAMEGESVRPAQAAGREVLQAIGQEIRRSYERVVGGRQKQLDEALARLSLSPEKEASLRLLVSNHFQATLGTPTPAQQREFVAAFMKELTPEQRRTLLTEVYGPSRPKK